MTTISDMNPPSEPPLHSPIIACIDFSEDSRAALIWACRMADNSGGTLILLHIVHDLASHPGFYHPEKSDHLEPMQDVAQSMMDDFLEQMRSGHPGLASLATAGIRLVPGLPATRIVEIAGLLNASLLVMGAHGMASHSHRRLGSVVERVAELSKIPVVIVRSDSAGAMSKKELKKREKRQKKDHKMLKKLLGLSSQNKAGENIDD
jgi:nucleotide-binding universal stress UspA family protein